MYKFIIDLGDLFVCFSLIKGFFCFQFHFGQLILFFREDPCKLFKLEHVIETLKLSANFNVNCKSSTIYLKLMDMLIVVHIELWLWFNVDFVHCHFGLQQLNQWLIIIPFGPNDLALTIRIFYNDFFNVQFTHKEFTFAHYRNSSTHFTQLSRFRKQTLQKSIRNNKRRLHVCTCDCIFELSVFVYGIKLTFWFTFYEIICARYL